MLVAVAVGLILAQVVLVGLEVVEQVLLVLVLR
jgi:hypothetical protein